MSNSWRLGLDLGTASVGAVAIALDSEGNEIGVPWHHVRIFQEPNEKGQAGLTPKKAARRQARQQRRQLERRARRVRKVAHLAPLIGIDPVSVSSDGRKGFELPGLRAKAARERVELPDLLRILLRMAKKRGYAGGFRAVADDAELGVVREGSSALQTEMAALASARGVEFVTLGEYLAERLSRGLPARLKTGREDLADRYALRGMVEQEFELIWTTQEKHHPLLCGMHRGRPLREIFRDALFFQRPLKSPAPSVGLCPLERNLPRSPRAQMAAQSFRIEKTLGDLRWGAGRLAQPLTAEQRDAIRAALNDPGLLTKDGEISFKKLNKVLAEAGCPPPQGRALNIDRASREVLKGNTTLKAFDLMGLLDQWRDLADRHQVSVINLLADLGSPQQLDPDDWYRRFLKAGAHPSDENRFRRFAPEVIAFVDLLRDSPGYKRFSRMGFEGGRSAYSIKALRRLTAWLQDPSWTENPGGGARIDEEAAIRECYPEAGKAEASTGELRDPPLTGNDTVDVALTQVHWVVRQALRDMGSPPAEIIVEFGREVGLSPGKRNEWETLSARNQRLRRQAKNEIVDAGSSGSNTEVRRYLLWQEQDTHCPYCERPLTLAQILDGHQSHVEHIIPRSLTSVGRKRSEIVIAHAECNNLKGDRTPYEAFGHDASRWTLIEERSKALAKKRQFRKARLLLLKDFEREVLNDASIADFVDRQLHQTSWIARAVGQWLRSLCPNVFAARGEFTAMLRRSWHLDTVIPEVRLANGLAVMDTDGAPVTREEFEELRPAWEGHGRPPSRTLEKRLDHRHHLVDALVIGLASRRLYQKLAKNYKETMEHRAAGGRWQREWSVEPPLADIRATALMLVRDCLITHKPDRYPSGALFQDTAYAVRRIDGEESMSLVSRKALADLLVEKSVEATRKQIETIASPDVRALVMAEFDRRIACGQSPKEALAKPIEYPAYGTAIRRVRTIRSDVSGDSARLVSFTSRHGEHSKALLPDGNAYLELVENNDRTAARVVSLAEAATRRYEPVPRHVRRFCKGDTVTDRKDGARLVVKQIKAVGGGKLILAPVFETRPVRELKASDGLRVVTGASLNRLVFADVLTPRTSTGGPPQSRH